MVALPNDGTAPPGGDLMSAAAWMLTLAGLLFVLAVLSKGDM